VLLIGLCKQVSIVNRALDQKKKNVNNAVQFRIFNGIQFARIDFFLSRQS